MTEELKRLVEIVKRKLEALPETGGMNDDREQYRAKHNARQAALIDALDALTITDGAAYRADYRGGMFRLGGVQSTSTGGLEQAVRNWLTSAAKRIGGDADE